MKKDQARDTIHAGTILIKDDTVLPEVLQIESEPCVPGWRLVKDLNGYALDRKVREAGWTFFCLAGEIRTIAFGADEQCAASQGNPAHSGQPESRSNSIPWKLPEWLRNVSSDCLTSVWAPNCRHVQEGLDSFLCRAPSGVERNKSHRHSSRRMGCSRARKHAPPRNAKRRSA